MIKNIERGSDQRFSNQGATVAGATDLAPQKVRLATSAQNVRY